MLIGATRLELVQGDITRQATDAIVNAANSRLAGGGGVDGAIHRAGGPSIMAECRKIGGCPTGQAVLTTGGDLPARYVIHAVGPIYHENGQSGEEQLLTDAYTNSLRLAVQHELVSISFPALSTGAYSYPVNLAAVISLLAVYNFLSNNEHRLELVRFVLFNEEMLEAYQTASRRLVDENWRIARQ